MNKHIFGAVIALGLSTGAASVANIVETAKGAGASRLNATDYDKSMAVRAGFETRRPDEHPFSIGQAVSHAKFGEGVVVNFEGNGLDARVQVKFRSDGEKWLALQFAKLMPA